MWLTITLWMSAAVVTVYLGYPALCRRSATKAEARGSLAGDDLVAVPSMAYTLAITIGATPREVWQWLAQLGEGGDGRYSYAWVDSLLRGNIRHAAQLEPTWPRIEPGDRIWLTSQPEPLDPRHHVLVVSAAPAQNLVLLQAVPDRRAASWAFVVRARDRGARLVFRHRAVGSRIQNLLRMPLLYFMDRGLLKAIKRRAERAHPFHLAAA